MPYSFYSTIVFLSCFASLLLIDDVGESRILETYSSL